jgi:chemotaxis protein MotA
MDWASLVGIAIGISGLLFGQTIGGGQLQSLLQPMAIVIVLAGTFGALLLQSNFKQFLSALLMINQVFKTPKDDREIIYKKFHLWLAISRKNGLTLLEPYLENETDSYIKKGLRLTIDEAPVEKIKEICITDIYLYEQKILDQIKVWSDAGTYAPTIGILGAVIGLIHVMGSLSDPSNLGSGIAAAFVSTIYGVGLANLLFFPIAHKLKMQLKHEILEREMILEGLVTIANKDTPTHQEELLSAYLQ